LDRPVGIPLTPSKKPLRWVVPSSEPKFPGDL
jgi:hypothetical protein